MSSRRSSSVAHGSHGSHGSISRRSPSVSVFDVLSAPIADPGDAPPAKKWDEIPVSTLIKGTEPLWIDGEITIEKACQILIEEDATCLLIRKSSSEPKALRYFDYSDIVAFLLLVLGYGDSNQPDFEGVVKTARQGGKVPVSSVADLAIKDPLVNCSEKSTLGEVVQIFASGVRRVAVVQHNTEDVIGILSQKTAMRYFWKYDRTFPQLEPVYSATLQELQIGNTKVISILGERKVVDAFEIMNTHSVSSLAVIDNQGFLLGNISDTDVKFVTRTSSVKLLNSNCAQFLSKIKFEQGLRDGKDSAPHFSVALSSTLAYTVAKLVATSTHRLWLVHSGSAPSTPSFVYPTSPGNLSTSLQEADEGTAPNPPGSASSSLSTTPMNSGELQGVISLTDVMSVFARTIGCVIAPTTAREQRQRRASSVSSREERPSVPTSLF